MKLFVFKCRDNDHKNDNMKINRGMKGKKKRPPGGKPQQSARGFMQDAA
ncbi:hypothetical protein EAXG_01673 [Escherichia coli TA054]|nr:hypothetical protein EAXG_01673 [Escherichia coli TA054]